MSESMSIVHGEPFPEPLLPLYETFVSAVELYPNNLAVAATHQPPVLFGIHSLPLDDAAYREKSYLRWTYKDLKAGIDRATKGLRSLGLHEGMPVLTFLTNGVEILLLLYATGIIGGVMAPINPRNLSNKGEVIHMIKTVMTACPGQPPVIFALDHLIAEQLDSLPLPEGAIKVIIQGEVLGGWIGFDKIMATTENQLIEFQKPAKPVFYTIMFTSGTTSLPKGVLFGSDRTVAVIKSWVGSDNIIVPEDRWCIVPPNNHVMFYYTTLASLSAGAAVVYPGAAFDPRTKMAAMRQEKVTHSLLVPAMLHALLGLKGADGKRPEHLKVVGFGGSLLTPAILRLCVEGLGCKVENLYGTTEGPVITTGTVSEPYSMAKGQDVSVGRVRVGTGVKVCAPGETEPLERGVSGELHFTSAYIHKDIYVGRAADEVYFDEQGLPWYKTGDLGTIDTDGRIFIVGRAKDMIVRGGENISPAAIEDVLAATPGLASVQLQVVAIEDAIAGEVPVVVANAPVDPDAVQQAIIERMGLMYSPEEVLTLAQLGLDDWPRTMSNKIQKFKVAESVRNYIAARDATAVNGTLSQLEDNVKSIWAKVVGLSISKLSELMDSPISEFADSITVMRVRDRIMKQTGQMLSIPEMAEAKTISGQITLLKAQSLADTQPRLNQRPIRQGPPQLEEMVHLTEYPELLDPTKQLVSKALSSYELSWDDVEDIIPAYDYGAVIATSGNYDSMNFKISIMPTNVDKKGLRSALEILLKNHRMLASFLVWDRTILESDVVLHVALRQDKKLFDQVIQDAGTVKSVEELNALALRYPHPEHAMFPGPLFRALLYHVEETNSAALVTNVNHAVIDASYAHLFQDDLDRVLSGTPLIEHVDYKLWADSYYALRTSPEARAATKWHVKRLKHVASHKAALWPSVSTRRKFDPAVQDGDDGLQCNFEVPNILKLRKEHCTLTAIAVLKAAHALLNVHRTGYTHALFGNNEAARTVFPFLPKSLESTGQFEAVDVAGPTYESVINLIEVRPDETVLEFLNRVQHDQTDLTKYASAPWREIMTSLGKTGDLLPEIMATQFFNWVPGLGQTGTNPYKSFKVVNAVVRLQVGLSLNAGLGGPDSSTVFLHLRTDVLDVSQLQGIAGDLEKITTWITNPDNWTQKIGKFKESLA